MSLINAAQKGYEAYVLQLSLYQDGDPIPPTLPRWEELSKREQLAWINAASHIINEPFLVSALAKTG